MAQLPPSPFLNSTIPTVESAVASKPPPAADATAAPSDGQDMHAGMHESNNCGPLRDGATSDDTMQESRPAYPAMAPSETDHIHEIFHYVRKLMKQSPRFVLDEAAFMAEVEEEPLFIRDGVHLRRWA